MSDNTEKVKAVVWGNNPPDRYVPRALEPGKSKAWGIWDRKEKRFLTGDETASMTFENVCEQHFDA